MKPNQRIEILRAAYIERREDKNDHGDAALIRCIVWSTPLTLLLILALWLCGCDLTAVQP